MENEGNREVIERFSLFLGSKLVLNISQMGLWVESKEKFWSNGPGQF